MHMIGPYMSTTRYSGKGKKGPNTASARQAKINHDNWLKKQGLHLEQLELAKTINGEYKNILPDLTVKSDIPLGNNIPVSGGYKNSILNNLHKESKSVRQQILSKANQIAPAFSKGAYQYITPGSDLTDIGKKK